MISPDLKKLADSFGRTTWIIWFAFAFAPVIYSAIAWIITEGGEKPVAETEIPAEAIYVAVLLAFLSGIVLPWVIAPRFLGPARMMQHSDMRPVSFDGENAEVFARLSERDQQRASMLGGIQAARIVQWAGAESVAIYGLLAMMIGVASMQVAWMFSLAAVALLVMLRPNFEADLETL